MCISSEYKLLKYSTIPHFFVLHLITDLFLVVERVCVPLVGGERGPRVPTGGRVGYSIPIKLNVF